LNYVGSFEITQVFYGHLLQFTAMIAAFKMITLVMPFLFPKPQQKKKKGLKEMEIAAQCSNDPVVIESLNRWEKIKAEFDQSQSKFQVEMSAVMYKLELHECDVDEVPEPESDERHNRIHR